MVRIKRLLIISCILLIAFAPGMTSHHSTVGNIISWDTTLSTQRLTQTELTGGFYCNPYCDSFLSITLDTFGNLYWHSRTAWVGIGGGGGGGISSLSSGYGWIASPNPITVSGSGKVDTSIIAYWSRISSTYELLSHKVTNFSSPNNTNYPTTSAVNSLVSSYRLISDSGFNGGYMAYYYANNHFVQSVLGTSNRITSTGGLNPIIDISASYIGQSSITTVGTLSTAVYQGTPIVDAYIASASIWNSKQSALTFSGGVTNSAGNVTVDAIQNISRLSNLSSNGYVKTGSGNGTLSIISTIPNADLTNSSITINSISTSLGGSVSVTDAILGFSDITTNNSSTSNHGFLKKLDNTATHYMDGTGVWSTPAGTTYTNGTGLGLSGNTFSITTVNPSPASYGSSTQIPVFTVNNLGQVTSVTNTTITQTTIVYNVQSGTSYTVLSSDKGKIIEFTSNSAITLTIPASLGSGFKFDVRESGTGNITISMSSTTWDNPHSFTKTYGKGSVISIVESNTNDTYTIQGDMQ